MPLYRCEATLVVYLVADSLEDAECEAGGALADEAGDNQPEPDTVREVRRVREIDSTWLNCIPRGDHEFENCREAAAAAEAEDAERRAKAPDPGQLGLPI